MKKVKNLPTVLSNIITEKNLTDWKNAFDEAEKYQSKVRSLDNPITVRINYIVRKVSEILDRTVEYWNYSSGDTLTSSDFSMGGDFIHLRVGFEISKKLEFKSTDRYVIFTKEGYEWGWDGCDIPKRWLFEDFEDEVREGRDKYQEFVKNKRNQKETKNQKLIKSAKSKLTPEELEAIQKAK